MSACVCVNVDKCVMCVMCVCSRVNVGICVCVCVNVGNCVMCVCV